MTSRTRVGVLISGRGSNMVSLAEAAAHDDFPAQIALVISNEPGAAGLARAADFGIETATINHRDYADRPAFEDALSARMRDADCDLICNAGFMRLLTPRFVDAWRDRHLNIHPSLLPAFKGLHTHQRVLDEGVRITGCTVHVVRAEMDAGPIVAQAAVPVCSGDDADRLAARVLVAEHQLYPHALRLFASGAASVESERIVIHSDADASASTLFSPELHV
ncbi:MAG: phosphoribosylglycinamide formyltransferase [Pseudomonadota bacterium]